MASQIPSLPPACANCIDTLQLATPGAAAIQNATQQFRSIEGKIRFDFGTSSLITNPLTQERMLLDHLKQEVRIFTTPPAMPAIPGMPQTPQMPRPPVLGMPSLGAYTSAAAQKMNMVNLGKSIVEGLEAEGVRYMFQALNPLKPPSIASLEVWTSTKLKLPVLTTMIGEFGQRINRCKCTAMQPPASLFQIPPGYKIVPPEAPSLSTLPVPKVPAVPTTAALPLMPQVPAMPQAPTLPQAPSLPTAPAPPSVPAPPSTALPSTPNLPSAPTLPSTPSVPSPTSPAVPKLPKF